MFQRKQGEALSGGVVDGWKAWNITSDSETGIILRGSSYEAREPGRTMPAFKSIYSDQEVAALGKLRDREAQRKSWRGAGCGCGGRERVVSCPSGGL